jgi:hypothetical protein
MLDDAIVMGEALLALAVDPATPRCNQTVESNFSLAEAALDSHQLQIRGHRGWYDVRRNGRTKQWKHSPGKASIPVKVGLRECLRLDFNFYDHTPGCQHNLRVRPMNFDPRNRKL